MIRLLPVMMLAITLAFAGCDDTSYYKSTPSNLPANDAGKVEVDTDRVDVDIKTNDTPIGDRIERRLDRRENLRDAIDKVDVDVNAGDAKVDVR